jgi:hypothetical protein
LLIKVGDTGDTSTVNIPFCDFQLRITLKTDPIVPGVSPDPLIEKYFLQPLLTLTLPLPTGRQALPSRERVTGRSNFALIPFINYHTITQNRTQWRE